MADIKKVTETMYKGKYKLTGVDGQTGQPLSFEVELPAPTTIDGVFNVAQGHFALIRRDGFAAEEIKDPAAEKPKV